MRFVADSMLGRLARWLRILGYDTVYFPHIEDRLILRIAREEDRILLTRDRGLVKVRGLKRYLLLRENDPFKQLKEVITALRLTPYRGSDRFGIPSLVRCPVCNALLRRIPKEEAEGHVPEYVYNTVREFKRCPGCGRFYWKGTHPERAQRKLTEVLSDC
jgi:hypothetical protein